MSEEKDLKKTFGNLGLYLVEKAQEEIKKFNQQTLFQKAEIKKRFFERSNDRTLKLKETFIDNYDHFLNQMLSNTLLKGKEKFMDLKNRLIKELKSSLAKLIKEKIEKNYPKYIEFLINNIKEITKTIAKPQEIELVFNSKDYDYLLKNYSKIQDLFKSPVETDKDSVDFIGGFKIIMVGGAISYDYTIDNLIDIKSSFIQMEISKIVNDSEIKQIEDNFNKFIQNQKTKITEYLGQYDQIQF
ncbi:MAG: V-type ATP synthase subunit E family protein [Promethearchaeota archaeon]